MNLSFRQYRTIDLTILLIVLAASEALTAVAAKYWFTGEIYVLSPTVAVLCIVMMRWSAYAAVHAVVGGLALCIAVGAEPKEYLIYCIGNCFALLALLMFRALGKEKIRASILLSALFTLCVFCAVQVGRWAVGLCFGGTLAEITGFFVSDSLSLLFAVVTVQITRRLDGVFEDQKSYLIRTQAQRQREEMGEPDEDERY